ncbi:cell division protein ftsA [Clostridium sp. CAG:465]|mgnify:FL=1|nr:cell division protein ftsA [Clostridium sp. CAG:465]
MAIGDIIVGLDLGATKISCVIGQVNKFSEIEVIGYGLSDSSGIKKGRILDPQSVANAVRNAVDAAEEVSDLIVNSTYVNIKGMNTRIEKVTIETEVEKPNDGMSINDIYNSYSRAQMAVNMTNNEQIIDLLPIEYTVNGRKYKEEPIGAFCKSFSLEAQVVIANGEYIAGVQRVLKLAGLRLDGLILETLATSNIVLMPEEKDMGVLLVDIGGGHTDISVYKNNIIEFYTTLPVGGDHITNDIAMTLDITSDEAEKLKRQYNLAIMAMIANNHDVKLNTKMTGENEVIRCSEIVQIIEARVKEIYQLIKKMISDNKLNGKIDCMVLTGQGISNIVGAQELAMLILKINQVRVCNPKLINVIKPQHATVFGMVRYIASLGVSKHVNSDVEIVTDLTFKEKIIEGIRNIKDKFKGAYNKTREIDNKE